MLKYDPDIYINELKKKNQYKNCLKKLAGAFFLFEVVMATLH